MWGPVLAWCVLQWLAESMSAAQPATAQPGAAQPDAAQPERTALDLFDRYQNESLMIIRNVLFLLLGIILFSANISPVSRAFFFH